MAAKSAAENNIRVLQNALRDVGQRSYVNVEESAILKLVMNQLRKETERHKTILEKLEKYGVHTDRIIIALVQSDPSTFCFSEARKFSQLYNARIEYYRALQHISDQVKVWHLRSLNTSYSERLY